MSASLVGSEMCIRDRRLVRDSALGARFQGALRGCQCVPRVAQGLGDAVSYTHLTLPTICSV
eukprot:6638955-Alexandrium_andersonii.AAC.1